MNYGLRLVTNIYALLVRFYPSNFRDEFEEEMRDVLLDLIEEATKRDRLAVISIFLRELRDWPRVMFAEHWLGLKKSLGRISWSSFTLTPSSPRPVTYLGHIMNNSQQLNLDDRPSAILTGLPPLLFGLGIALNALIYQGPWYRVPSWRLILSIVIGLIPMIAIAYGAILSLLRRLPDWGWTWLGSAFIGIVLFVKTLVEEMADEGRPLTSPTGETVIMILILFTGAILISVAALRCWRRAGLLSLGLAGTMGLSMCMAITAAPFNRTDLALLAAPLGLLMALLIYTFARGSNAIRLTVIFGVGLLNAGLIGMANHVWMDWLTTRGSTSPLLPLLIFSTILLLVGPIAGLFFRPIQRMFGRV